MARSRTTSNVTRAIAPRMERTKVAVHTALAAIERKLIAAVHSRMGKSDTDDAAEMAEFLDTVLTASDFQTLVAALTPEIRAMFSEAGINLLQELHVSDDASITRQLDEGALAYAKQRAATLVGMRIAADGSLKVNPNAAWAIDDATRDMLQADIAEAVKSGASAQDLARTIEDNHAFSESRALTIARTELAFAAVAGHMASGKLTGAVGKRSLLGSEHDADVPAGDECDDAAADGVIAIDDPFSTGDDGPPYHPACVCDVELIYPDDERAADLE